MSSVIVVGSVNVDLVVEAPHLPGPGETVVGPRVQTFGGGKGANAAVAAARSGAAVTLVGAVGADDTGRAAVGELAADGVDIGAVTSVDEPTGMALIVVDPHGENLIAVGSGANSAVTAELVDEALGARLGACGCVLVSAELPLEAIEHAVRAAVSAGVPCVLNPAPARPGLGEVARLGPILTPNEGELSALLAEIDLGRAEDLVAFTGAPVLVTRGGAGVEIFTSDGSVLVPAPVVTVRDTTGAGDTFNGWLAARLAAGDTLVDAVSLAVRAASLSVEAVGAREGMPTWNAVRSSASG